MEDVRLGPYQLVAELGSGGMGKVYRAEVGAPVPGLEAGRPVALKVIHAHLLETPGFFKRFLREADIGRTIEHENVVRTYDCDALLLDGVQQNFLVMEYVEGQTLRELLEELERVPEELCRHIGREIAKGLEAIHGAGVVHRDLKPENVLITPDHVVKVMDLGVARLQDEAIRLSQTGAFLGSIEYAAPEQFRSADGEPDGRADLHALGVVLYELATGRHPFHDEDVSKVLRNILDETPRKAGEVNPQLSPFFEEVIQALLAKDREARIASAAALRELLEEGERSAWWKDRAHALSIETKRPLRRIRIPRETALYGRDDDLAKLHALYDMAQAGDGQVLLIEGEAGIGKTRLVDEFVGRLRSGGEDVNFLFGSYPPGGAATAAGAFSAAYREHFGEEGLEGSLDGYLTPTPTLIPAFAALLRGETAPTGAAALTKDSLQTVFVHATRALAAERTTIVLIDDLHFAPSDGRALFSSLAMAIPGHRILLLGTMRPGVPEEWTANITRLDHAEQRSLARLGPKDLSHLLKDAFRSERLARELSLQIGEKSDGNPFFAFEIIRGLREGQFISQRPDGTWRTTKVIQDIQVPSSVLDLVNARVADLGEDERSLLDMAACCGYAFDPVVTGEALGLARVPTLRALGRIERRHRLVRSQGRKYVFDHHQVQEALYGALNEYLREDYHAAIAEVLERRADAANGDPEELDGTSCVDLCEHFLKGARGEKGLRYLDAGLTHLENSFLNEQAIALADRALDVPGLLGGKARLRVLLRKNSRLRLLGSRAAQETVLAEARALAEADGDKSSLAEVERATGGLHYVMGRLEEAKTAFGAYLALTQEIGDRRGEAYARGNLANVDAARGDPRGLELRLRNLEFFQQCGDRRAECLSRLRIGQTYLLREDFVQARTHFEAAIALARVLRNRELEADAAVSLGAVHRAFDHYADALELFRRSHALALSVGDRLAAGMAAANLAGLYLSFGRHEEAKELGEQALALSRETGYQATQSSAVGRLAQLAAETGDVDEAVRLAEDALALCPESGLRLNRGISLVELGWLRWRAGDADAARERLDEAITLFRELRSKGNVVWALAHLACLPSGDPEAAEAALADAREESDSTSVRFLLWKATGDRKHLQAAKRLLDHLVEHAPEEYRESMRTNVRLHREIMEAWAEP